MVAFVDRDARGFYSVNDLSLLEFSALAEAMTRLDEENFRRLEPVCRQMLGLIRQANAELEQRLRSLQKLSKQYQQ